MVFRLSSNMSRRAPSFTTVEIKVIFDLVARRKLVIENKKTDATSNRLKYQAWDRIAQEFNNHKDVNRRTAAMLKTCWANLKKKSRRTSVAKSFCLENEDGESSDKNPQIESIERSVNIPSHFEPIRSNFDPEGNNWHFQDLPENGTFEVIQVSGTEENGAEIDSEPLINKRKRSAFDGTCKNVDNRQKELHEFKLRAIKEEEKRKEELHFYQVQLLKIKIEMVNVEKEKLQLEREKLKMENNLNKLPSEK